MAAISEIRVGMGVFSAEHARIGTVHVVGDDRITLLGDPDSAYEGGHYQAATVLIGSVEEGRVVLSNDAEAALILEEAYSEASPKREHAGDSGVDSRGGAAANSGAFDSLPAKGGSSSDRGASSHSRSGPSTAMVVGLVLACAVAVSAIPLLFGGRKRTETRPQQAGEAATTRFGMEDGDNMDIPATGGVS